MKLIKTAVLTAMCLGTVVGSARAQETVVVKVPFTFMMRGQEFSAGRYRISREGDVLAVRGLDNGGTAFAVAMPAGGRDPAGHEPALVFTRYERECQLSEIWENETEGLAIPEPSAASHHAKAQAIAPAAPTVVRAAISR